MTITHSLRVTMPCPSCHVRQPLSAAYRAGSVESTEAVLSECPRCWAGRAQALNEARARLRQTGELGKAGPRLTWMGEVLGPDRETDGLQGALMSALLRRGLTAPPSLRLALPAAQPQEAAEPAQRGR